MALLRPTSPYLRLWPLTRATFGRRFASTKNPQRISEILDWEPEGVREDVTVNGYVRSVRTMKSEMFVSVGDGSTRRSLQALVPRHMERG